jgi:SAM-dependent methyltransferase
VDAQARLLEATTRPYAAAGRAELHRARGKLRRDPVYFFLLRKGLLPRHGRLLDLGCGRGLLLALVRAARECHRDGAWPDGWEAPPADLALAGIDLRAEHVEIARLALGERTRLEVGDLRALDFAPCEAILLLDVLFYLDAEEQRSTLVKAVAALEQGGVLLVREADAGAGPAFEMTRLSERVLETLRGRPLSRLRYRRAADWVDLLRSLGLEVSSEPMSAGTPFANVLFIGRKIR